MSRLLYRLSYLAILFENRNFYIGFEGASSRGGREGDGIAE